MYYICKICKKEFLGKPSRKRKYCSFECMRKDPDYRIEISKGVKEKGYKNSQKQQETLQKATFAAREARIKKYGKWEDRFVRCKHTGQILDITNKQLEDYRKNHLVCEICGKSERVSTNKKTVSKLCCDHDHKTSKFRGLLCCDCNRKLGWYENNKENIEKYLAPWENS